MAAGLAMLQVKCKPKFFTRLAEKTAYLAAGIDKVTATVWLLP
jgi:glutamate-1-semialdehyde aminotransferase